MLITFLAHVSLASSLFSLGLASYVLYRHPRKTENVSFSAGMAALSLIAFGKFMEYNVTTFDGRLVVPGDLELPAGGTPAGLEPLKEVRSRIEREHIRKALANRNWNISQVAAELGVSRPTLHDLIKKYRIRRDG